MRQIFRQPTFKITFLFIFIILITGCKKKEESQAIVTLPSISTLAPVEITSTTAIVGGHISNNGGSTILQKGVCYSDAADPLITDSIVSDHNPGVNYTFPVTGLKPNTIYFAKAFAINSAGIRYGEEINFTTLKEISVPVLSTLGITDITEVSATSGGDVTGDGGAAITGKGICWSKSHMPTLENDHTTDAAGIGEFVSHITDLTLRTGYFVRAYATNVAGTAYGNERSFTTTDSITGQPCPGIATILYQGKTYHTVLIGQKCWFKENLNVGTRINGNTDMIPLNGKIEKYCYNDLESNCDIYGALYQWDEVVQANEVVGARGICPLGWHIPTYVDWNNLTNALGGFPEAGNVMKFNTLWFNGGNGTNSSGFSGLPGGLRYYDGSFTHLGDFGYTWSSEAYSTPRAWDYILNYSNTNLVSDFEDKVLGFSARCVKDSLR